MPFNTALVHKILFVAHLNLSIYAMSVNLFPNGYLLSQALIVAMFLWSLIDKERSEPNYLLTVIAIMACISDSIIIGISWSSSYVFIGLLAIGALILKPVIAFISYNLGRQIDGQSGMALPTFGKWGNGQQGYTQEPTTATYGGTGYQQA